MLKNNVIRKTLLMAFIIFDIGIIIFGLLTPIDWHLIVGWVCGSIASIVGYIVSVFLLQLTFKKLRTKSSGFWLGWLRVYAHLGIHATFFILVILINTAWHGSIFKAKDFFDLVNPINILTYIGGISIITVSTLVIHISKKRR